MDIVALPIASPAAASEGPLHVERPRPSSFKEVLVGLSERMDRGEASVQTAMRAAPQMGPAGELLMLQASVYQYTETFEVAAKMVDKGTSAIKTTLQGQ